MVVEVVLPRLEAEAFSGGDVGGEVVEVEGLGWDEVVLIEGFLVEGVVGFVSSDILREVVMIEEGKFRVLSEESAGVEGVGVREEDEAVAIFLKVADDLPHRGVQAEDVVPGSDKFRGGEFLRDGGEGAGDEVIAAYFPSFVRGVDVVENLWDVWFRRKGGG